MVVTPLAVCAGEKVPQVPVGVQVQSTPAFAESFVTVALTVAVPPMVKEAGGAVASEMDTAAEGAEIATVAVAVTEWLLVEVAVIVTLPPLGAVDGAVYMVAAPLAVCAGLKVPHDPAGAQLQSTPPLALSFDTVAEIIAVALAASVAGGAWLSAMEMVGGGFDADVEFDPQPDKLPARTSKNAAPHNSNVHLARPVFTTSSYKVGLIHASRTFRPHEDSFHAASTAISYRDDRNDAQLHS
ncbi:MAG TPA: hypothetical protein VH161_09170 [Candidatus Acidoferrales bacterium]|nr:hypothetical protein [Candidatus Acidoferrales bacterium]